jgi:nitrogen-specific signal transduction histidine kinase
MYIYIHTYICIYIYIHINIHRQLMIRIIVEDTGIGIPDDVKRGLFQPFAQVLIYTYVFMNIYI